MPPDPFNDLDPDQTVSVLPRYLAGPGTLDLHTVWPFPFDDGWHLHPADEGMVFASSPCARLWTRFVPEPDKRNKGTWTISANRVPFGQLTWQINFDATTPVELLHDVHAELLDLSSDQERLFEDVTAHYEAYWPLFAPGWSHHVKTDGTLTFLAPDGLGSVSHQYATTGSDEPIWQAGGGHPTEPHWTASFARHAYHTRRGLHRIADLHRATTPRREEHPLPDPQSPLRPVYDSQAAARPFADRPAACGPGGWPDPMTSPHLIKEPSFSCMFVSFVAPSGPLPSPLR